MKLDVYLRHEPGQKRSYLVVPAGQELPQEVTSAEWVAEARALDLNEHAAHFEQYGIDNPERQLKEKGYAITSLDHQMEDR